MQRDKYLLFLSILAVYDTEHKDGEIVFGFLILLGFNVLFAIIASTLVAFEVRIVYLLKAFLHGKYSSLCPD